MKEKIQVIFLKLAFIIAGIITILFALFLFPGIAKEVIYIDPDLAYLRWPFLILLELAGLVFLFALVQALRLMVHIDQGQVFSLEAVRALGLMKIAGTTMTILLYFVALPLGFLIAETEDAPGTVPIFFLIASIPLVVAAFVAVLERLLREAVAIKNENEFTV